MISNKERVNIVKAAAVLLFAAVFAVTAARAQTQQQWRDSLRVVNGLIELHPDSVGLQLDKAAVCLQLHEWEDAITACGKVLGRDGGNLSALFYRAYANNNLRRYEQARSDYADFLRMAPDNMEARFGLAYTYSRMGRSQEALDELNNLVEMYPDSSVVYAARAELEKDMKLYDTALYDFDEALKRDPGNRDYTVLKVEILILLDRRGEAKAALDEAVKRGVPRGLLLGLYAKCK